MELVEIFKTLGRHKRALAGVTLVALAVAVLSAYSVGPSGLKKRGETYGTAQAQVLVDSPQSALANLKQDTVPLSTRAGVFAQFMASSAVRGEVAKATGIPADKIFARGPFDDPAIAPSGTEIAAPPEPPAESAAVTGRPYQLTFVAQEELPLVTVYAEAPTAALAKRLADGVAVGVKAHVRKLQDDGKLDQSDRVAIRGLGPAEAGTVTNGSSGPLMVVAFLVIMLIGAGLILAVARSRERGDREPDAAERDVDEVEGDFEDFLTQVDFDDEPDRAPRAAAS